MPATKTAKSPIGDRLDRVDGRQKVTGAATYAAEYDLPNLTYAVLVGSTVTKGRVTSLDTRAAERAPGVVAVISHLNAPKVPGYVSGKAKGSADGQQLRVFFDDQVYFADQPVALVVADSWERARYAARLVEVRYAAAPHDVNLHTARAKGGAKQPKQAQNPKAPLADYDRGQPEAWKSAPVTVEAEYLHPSNMHNPMELQAITAHWEGDRLTVYDKTQAVLRFRSAYATEWDIPEDNITLIAPFVGGAFGNALRTWPHQTAAIMAARQVKRPVKLMLTREQMFTMVGYRPRTWQKVGLGATPDGKLVGTYHESVGQTSTYEEFTEQTLQQTKMMYASPNLATRYRILPLDLSTPTPMRGPGEATGAFALESAMDELAHKLNLDPLEFRLRNYTDTDPDKERPWSSKYLKECYQMGAERIGWKNRPTKPGTQRDGDWLVGYGMGVGTFGANRRSSKASITLRPDGTVLLQSAVTDIGPGTGTAMTQIAAATLGLPPEQVTYEWGKSTYTAAPTQGGSSIINSVGAAVQEVCNALKQQLATAAGGAFADAKADDLTLSADGHLVRGTNRAALADLLKRQPAAATAEVEAKPGDEGKGLSMYSFSVHFAHVRVHVLTGEVRVQHMVCCADAGTIINNKTASSQMIGGAIGGIGMALTEDSVLDDASGRYVTRDFASYHVPVHADAPPVDVLFVNQPDYHVNALGTKGIGEIATIGVAAAVANAVFNATGKRVRELPITPDKLL